MVFGDHPLARVSPTPAALDALTRDALVEFHKAHYVPDRAVLAVAGDITLAQAKSQGGGGVRRLEEVGRRDRPAQTRSRRRCPARAISLVVRPNSVQTSLRVGTQSIERTDPDYVALTVANRMLGGGPTGRLFEHLREQKGYTYGADSEFGSTPDRRRVDGVHGRAHRK